MKRLARKCKCGSIMIVQVGRGPVRAYPNTKPGYQKVECLQDCQLSTVSLTTGRVIGPVPQWGVVTDVICSRCSGLRRLTKFEEVKV